MDCGNVTNRDVVADKGCLDKASNTDENGDETESEDDGKPSLFPPGIYLELLQ